MAFDFIKTLLGVKPVTKIIETIVEPIIQESLKITEKNWKSVCLWSIKKIENNMPCALIIRREFLD